VAFKDRRVRGLAGPLGGLLAGAVRCLLDDVAVPAGQPVWLVPVPARPAARRARGMDHVAVLAAAASAQLRGTGLPAHRVRLLRHVGASGDQRGLGRRARRDNVAGTLVADSPPAGLLVLVDDVTTTGATLGEAARALRQAGGLPAGAAAVTWAAPLASRVEAG
jgi:predicted amidophosphoribosyltransferase